MLLLEIESFPHLGLEWRSTFLSGALLGLGVLHSSWLGSSRSLCSEGCSLSQVSDS